MPSGKRARQQRQQAAAAAAPPPVRSKGVGGARARQASPRALAIGGGIALAIVIAIVLGVVLSSGGGSGSSGGVVTSSDMQDLPATGSQTWRGAMQGAAEANNLFKGIPQNGLTLGDPKAPTEMEMFIDVQCPVCQDYEVNHLPSVVNKYIAHGEGAVAPEAVGLHRRRSRSPAGWASSPPPSRTRASSTRRSSTTISRRTRRTPAT